MPVYSLTNGVLIHRFVPGGTREVVSDLTQTISGTLNGLMIDPIKNRLTTDPAGTIFWNGSPIDLVTLRQYLNQTKNMTPEPELQFEPNAQTRYVVVDNMLAVIKRSGVTKLGFVGNERYGNF